MNAQASTTLRLPRGIRCNNPGNIRRTTPRTPWQGALPLGEAIRRDAEFEVFETPVKGLRAALRTFITYQDKYGLASVRQWISRWAPDSENDTVAYIRQVATAIRVEPDDEINVHDIDIARPLLRAVVRHENGDPRPYKRPPHWYADDVYAEALRQAGIVARKPPSLASDPAVQAGAAVGAGTLAQYAPYLPVVKDYIKPDSAVGSVAGVLVLLAVVYLVVKALRKRKVESQ